MKHHRMGGVDISLSIHILIMQTVGKHWFLSLGSFQWYPISVTTDIYCLLLVHQENAIRKDEKIKCELKLKNLTETFEVANNLTAYLPDVLNKTTKNQSVGNLEGSVFNSL